MGAALMQLFRMIGWRVIEQIIRGVLRAIASVLATRSSWRTGKGWWKRVRRSFVYGI